MARLRAGYDAALNDLMERHAGKLLHYLLRSLQDEEDAADLFATYVMLQFRNNQARKFLGGAAYSYMEFIQAGKDKPNVTVPLLAFSSDHGTPEERFYNLLCITYGSDQNMFADLVEKEYLPKSRAAGCKYEFQVLRYAFRNQIMPHIDQTLAERVRPGRRVPGNCARPHTASASTTGPSVRPLSVRWYS